MITLLNFFTVFLYGLCLTFFFSDIEINRKNLISLSLYGVINSVLQMILFSLLTPETIKSIYPFAVHIPILFFFFFYYKNPMLKNITALSITYIFTVPRNLLGNLLGAMLPPPNSKLLIQILITVPLIYLFYRFVRKPIISIYKAPHHSVVFFTIPLSLYYVFICVLTIKPTIFSHYPMATVQIISFIITVFFFVSSILFFQQLTRSESLQQNKALMEMVLKNTENNLEEILYSQQKTKTLRHDMRHSLNMIAGLAKQNRTDEILNYVKEIQSDIEQFTIREYCKIASLNAILSSCIGKAEKLSIKVSAVVVLEQIPDKLTMDLCSILANAIENATIAAKASKNPFINLSLKQLKDKYVLEITNSYSGTITFQNGLPISKKHNHGYGVSSIVSLVEKHSGVYSIKTDSEHELFLLKIVM